MEHSPGCSKTSFLSRYVRYSTKKGFGVFVIDDFTVVQQYSTLSVTIFGHDRDSLA
jgi:hypothetical protein